MLKDRFFINLRYSLQNLFGVTQKLLRLLNVFLYLFVSQKNEPSNCFHPLPYTRKKQNEFMQLRPIINSIPGIGWCSLTSDDPQEQTIYCGCG
jgi:hypothetical protein